MDSTTIKNRLSKMGSPIVVVSHPRSGTHLTIDLLRRHFPACASWKRFAERSDRLYLPLEGLCSAGVVHTPTTALDTLGRASRPIIKTHALPEFKEWMPDNGHWIDWLRERAKWVYVYRDGRKVMSSFFAGRAGMTKEPSSTFAQFLRQTDEGCSRPAYWAKHVRAWMDNDNTICVNYEELTRNTEKVLERLSRELSLDLHLRQPVLPPPIRSAWHGRWVRLVSRRPASTALVAGKLRHKPSEPWQRLFSSEDRAFFEKESDSLLVDLQYEQSRRWAEDTTADHG